MSTGAMDMPPAAARPAWRPPERRLLVFVAAVYTFIGARLLVAPSIVSGGPLFGWLFLAAAVSIAAHAVMPWRRHLRAFAGAISTVAPASRALVLIIDATVGDGHAAVADALLGCSAWLLIAGLLLYAWAHVTPPPRQQSP